MANIHILSTDGTEFTAVFHILIPASNNAAGVPWRTVVLRTGGGGQTVLPDGDGTLGTISAAEKAQIVSGAVVELVKNQHWDFAFPTGAQFDAIASDVQSEYVAHMQFSYNRYGVTR